MFSKWYTLLVLVLLTSGCAIFSHPKNIEELRGDRDPNKDGAPEFTNEKKSASDAYVGLRGYFSRPPIFETPSDETMFQRCAPFVIKGFQNRNNRVVMTVSQGSNTINLVGLNRKGFHWNKKARIYELDHYVLKELKLPKLNRSVANIPRACDGKLTANMTAAEMLFIVGSPESITNKIVNNQKVQEWRYMGKNKSSPITYYFASGRVYAWK